MKNRIIYLLLPLCVAFLPACSSSYTLTLVNSDPEAGTIITEGGKFKVGEQVHIETDVVQGYKITKWVDDVSGKVGSRSEFNFMMPNRDVTLTVYYEYDSFSLSFGNKGNSDESHYDINEFFKKYPYVVSCFYLNDDTTKCNNLYVQDFTWKDQVKIKYDGCFVDEDIMSFEGFYSEDGTKLGVNECTMEIPNHDTVVYFNYISKCRAVEISSNYPLYYNYYYMGNEVSYVSYYDAESVYHPTILIPDNLDCVTVKESYDYNGYIFDHWLNEDTGEIINEKSFTIEMNKPLSHYKLFVREAE